MVHPWALLLNFYLIYATWIMQMITFYSLHFLPYIYIYIYTCLFEAFGTITESLLHTCYLVLACMKMDVFILWNIFLLLAHFCLCGKFNPGVPLLNPRPIRATFSMKMDVFFSMQFFYYILIFAYSEHLTPWAPGRHYKICPIHVTFSMKMDVFCFLQFFAHLEHLTVTPGCPYWILVPYSLCYF